MSMKKTKHELKTDLLIDLLIECLNNLSQKGRLLKNEFKKKLEEIERIEE